jgi:hypothetical protein
MPDLCVCVPKWSWPEWLAEGDAAGKSESGTEWGFSLGRVKPPIKPGERLYIVAHNRLRGYAPVTGIKLLAGIWVICRQGGAVAVTIPEKIHGFQGFRRRWWDTKDELPFQDWKTEGVIL